MPPDLIPIVLAVLLAFACGVAAGWYMRPEIHRFLPSRRLFRTTRREP